MPTIIHVDMDAFFAAVEQLDDPSLRGKPLLVGGRSNRGVVAAASYEARRFGIHSAMPMVHALRRCPDAVVVPPRMNRYSEMSREVFAVFRRYTPLVEGLSVDEAFLDVTGSTALFGDGETIAKAIKSDIYQETRLTASAGVAACKFVAKVASDLDKPDGLVVVSAEDARAFLAPLPIKRMWGVGPKAQARLERYGLRTIGDLAAASEDTLRALLGSWGHTVKRLAAGIDAREVVPGRVAKSLGGEETFAHDHYNKETLEPALLRHSMRAADRLVQKGLWARCVTLKLKYADHTIRTRQVQLSEPVADVDSIYRAACDLLQTIELEQGVRLAGVSVSGLQGEPPLQLFADEDRDRRHKLEKVAADLRARFGAQGITRARLLDTPTHAGRHSNDDHRDA